MDIVTESLHQLDYTARRNKSIARVSNSDLKFDPKKSDHVAIGFNLSEPMQRMLVEIFTELKIDFDHSSDFNGHAIAASVRKCWNALFVHTYGGMGTIVDVGGNPLAHLHHDVHTCSPNLDTKDGQRFNQRSMQIRRLTNQFSQGENTDANVLLKLVDIKSVTNTLEPTFTKTACNMRSELCPQIAPVLISVDAIYDITVQQFFNMMVRHDANYAAICFIEPTGILLGASEGRVEYLNVTYTLEDQPVTDGLVSDFSSSPHKRSYNATFGKQQQLLGNSVNTRPKGRIQYLFDDGTSYTHENSLLDWSYLQSDGAVTVDCRKYTFHKNIEAKRLGYTHITLSLMPGNHPIAIPRSLLPASTTMRIIMNWPCRNRNFKWSCSRWMAEIPEPTWTSLTSFVKDEKFKTATEQYSTLVRFLCSLQSRVLVKGSSIVATARVQLKLINFILAAALIYSSEMKEKTLWAIKGMKRPEEKLWKKIFRYLCCVGSSTDIDPVDVCEFMRPIQFKPVWIYPQTVVVLSPLSYFYDGIIDGVNNYVSQTWRDLSNPINTSGVTTPLQSSFDVEFIRTQNEKLQNTLEATAPPQSISDLTSIKEEEKSTPKTDNLPPSYSCVRRQDLTEFIDTKTDYRTKNREEPLEKPSIPTAPAPNSSHAGSETFEIPQPEQLEIPKSDQSTISTDLNLVAIREIQEGDSLGNFNMVSPLNCTSPSFRNSLLRKNHSGGEVPSRGQMRKVEALTTNYAVINNEKIINREPMSEYVTYVVTSFNDTLKVVFENYANSKVGLKHEGARTSRQDLKIKNESTHVIQDGLVIPVASADADYVYTHPLLSPFWAEIEISAISHIELIEGHKFDISLVEGVPGSGKTYKLIQYAQPNTLIITANRSTKENISSHTNNCGVFTAMGALKTNHTGFRKSAMVDEVYMLHQGILGLIAHYHKINNFVAFGDRKQIPWISRCLLETEHSIPQGTVIANMTVSRRITRSAVNVLKNSYPEGISTENPTVGTIRIENINSHAELRITKSRSTYWLTFTQIDKEELRRFSGCVTNIMTIHEVQGETYTDVHVVRLNRSDNPLFAADERLNAHMLVAVSRNTDNFTYHTTIIDDPFSRLLRMANLQSPPPNSNGDESLVNAAIRDAMAQRGGAAQPTISLERGDIFTKSADAIVCACGTGIPHGAGIAMQISNVCGPRMMRELTGVKIPVARVHVTQSYDHKNTKTVVHAVAPDCRIREQNDNKDKLMIETLDSIMKVCTYNNIETILMPLIGCGKFRNPLQILTNSLREILSRSYLSHIHIKLVIDKEPSYMTVYDHLRDIVSDGDSKIYPFFGKDNPLSNFHAARFVISGQEYFCGEQYYALSKANTFGDRKSARDILRSNSAAEIKRISSNVRGFDQIKWTARSANIMEHMLEERFKQVERVREVITSNINKQFVEASRDRYWGCGFRLGEDQLYDLTKHIGKNILGKLWTKVAQRHKLGYEFKPTIKSFVIEEPKQPLDVVVFNPRPSSTTKLQGSNSKSESHLFDQLNDIKNRISSDFDDRRARINPIDKLRSGKFVNRSALKLIEMDFNTAQTLSRHDIFLDLCSAPGGFSEVMFSLNPRATGILVSNSEIAFHKKLIIEKRATIIVTDINKAGPLIDDLTNKIVPTLVMADGGISVENQEEHQEDRHKSLITSQVFVALATLQKGGDFLLKTYETRTDYMRGLLQLCSSSFQEWALFKPRTSRPTCSERYFLFKKYSGINEGMLDVIQEVDLRAGSLVELNTNFTTPLDTFGDQVATLNLTAITAAMSLSRTDNLNDPIEVSRLHKMWSLDRYNETYSIRSDEGSQALEHYKTPKEVIEIIRRHVGHYRGQHTFEPFCGEGMITNMLKEEGVIVDEGTDIVDRDYHKNTGTTFVKTDSTTRVTSKNFVGNPPFGASTSQTSDRNLTSITRLIKTVMEVFGEVDCMFLTCRTSEVRKKLKILGGARFQVLENIPYKKDNGHGTIPVDLVHFIKTGEKRKYSDNKLKKASKTMSYQLRHNKDKRIFVANGFMKTTILTKLTGIDLPMMKVIVTEDFKHRYAFKEINGLLCVRASNGHSNDTDLNLPRLTKTSDFTEVIHGTFFNSIEKIIKEGLNKMTRDSIHFTSKIGQGPISGMKQHSELAIYLDMNKCLNKYEFFMADNEVILTTGREGVIGSSNFSKIVDIKRGTIHEPPFETLVEGGIPGYRVLEQLMQQDKHHLDTKDLPILESYQYKHMIVLVKNNGSFGFTISTKGPSERYIEAIRASPAADCSRLIIGSRIEEIIGIDSDLSNSDYLQKIKSMDEITMTIANDLEPQLRCREFELFCDEASTQFYLRSQADHPINGISKITPTGYGVHYLCDGNLARIRGLVYELQDQQIQEQPESKMTTDELNQQLSQNLPIEQSQDEKQQQDHHSSQINEWADLENLHKIMAELYVNNLSESFLQEISSNYTSTNVREIDFQKVKNDLQDIYHLKKNNDLYEILLDKITNEDITDEWIEEISSQIRRLSNTPFVKVDMLYDLLDQRNTNRANHEETVVVCEETSVINIERDSGTTVLLVERGDTITVPDQYHLTKRPKTQRITKLQGDLMEKFHRQRSINENDERERQRNVDLEGINVNQLEQQSNEGSSVIIESTEILDESMIRHIEEPNLDQEDINVGQLQHQSELTSHQITTNQICQIPILDTTITTRNIPIDIREKLIADQEFIIKRDNENIDMRLEGDNITIKGTTEEIDEITHFLDFKINILLSMQKELEEKEKMNIKYFFMKSEEEIDAIVKDPNFQKILGENKIQITNLGIEIECVNENSDQLLIHIRDHSITHTTIDAESNNPEIREKFIRRMMRAREDMQEYFTRLRSLDPGTILILPHVEEIDDRLDNEQVAILCDNNIQIFNKKKEEFMDKYSALAGDRLRDNNPNITDVGDVNRPIKLAEQFDSIYTNQWTDAQEEMMEKGISEDNTCELLMETLKLIHQSIRRILRFDLHLHAGPNPSKAQKDSFIRTIPDRLDNVHEQILIATTDSHDDMRDFIKQTAVVMYRAGSQDPPMYFNFDLPEHIDLSEYTKYGGSGKVSRILVWPSLYLYYKQSLMNKGSIQPKLDSNIDQSNTNPIITTTESKLSPSNSIKTEINQENRSRVFFNRWKNYKRKINPQSQIVIHKHQDTETTVSNDEALLREIEKELKQHQSGEESSGSPIEDVTRRMHREVDEFTSHFSQEEDDQLCWITQQDLSSSQNETNVPHQQNHVFDDSNSRSIENSKETIDLTNTKPRQIIKEAKENIDILQESTQEDDNQTCWITQQDLTTSQYEAFTPSQQYHHDETITGLNQVQDDIINTMDTRPQQIIEEMNENINKIQKSIKKNLTFATDSQLNEEFGPYQKHEPKITQEETNVLHTSDSGTYDYDGQLTPNTELIKPPCIETITTPVKVILKPATESSLHLIATNVLVTYHEATVGELNELIRQRITPSVPIDLFTDDAQLTDDKMLLVNLITPQTYDLNINFMEKDAQICGICLLSNTQCDCVLESKITCKQKMGLLLRNKKPRSVTSAMNIRNMMILEKDEDDHTGIFEKTMSILNTYLDDKSTKRFSTGYSTSTETTSEKFGSTEYILTNEPGPNPLVAIKSNSGVILTSTNRPDVLYYTLNKDPGLDPSRLVELLNQIVTDKLSLMLHTEILDLKVIKAITKQLFNKKEIRFIYSSSIDREKYQAIIIEIKRNFSEQEFRLSTDSGSYAETIVPSLYCLCRKTCKHSSNEEGIHKCPCRKGCVCQKVLCDCRGRRGMILGDQKPYGRKIIPGTDTLNRITTFNTEMAVDFDDKDVEDVLHYHSPSKLLISDLFTISQRQRIAEVVVEHKAVAHIKGVNKPKEPTYHNTIESYIRSLTNACWISTSVKYINHYLKFNIDISDLITLVNQLKGEDGKGDASELVMRLVNVHLGVDITMERSYMQTPCMLYENEGGGHWCYKNNGEGYRHIISQEQHIEIYTLYRQLDIYYPERETLDQFNTTAASLNTTFGSVIDMSPGPFSKTRADSFDNWTTLKGRQPKSGKVTFYMDAQRFSPLDGDYEMMNIRLFEGFMDKAEAMTATVVIKTLARPELSGRLLMCKRPTGVFRMDHVSPTSGEVMVIVGEKGNKHLYDIIDSAVTERLNEMSRAPEFIHQEKDISIDFRSRESNIGGYEPEDIVNLVVGKNTYKDLKTLWLENMPFMLRNLRIEIIKTLSRTYHHHTFKNMTGKIENLYYLKIYLDSVKIRTNIRFQDMGVLRNLPQGLYSAALNQFTIRSRAHHPPITCATGRMGIGTTYGAMGRFDRHYSTFMMMGLPKADLFAALYVGRKDYMRFIDTYTDKAGINDAYRYNFNKAHIQEKLERHHCDRNCLSFTEPEIQRMLNETSIGRHRRQICAAGMSYTESWMTHCSLNVIKDGGALNQIYRQSAQATSEGIFEGFIDHCHFKEELDMPGDPKARDFTERFLSDATNLTQDDPVEFYWQTSALISYDEPDEVEDLTGAYDVIQHCVDEVAPGNSLIDNKYDDYQIEENDIELQFDCKIKTNNIITPAKDPERSEPTIRTGVTGTYNRTCKQMILAVNKRNANPPDLSNSMASDDQALLMMDKFFEHFCIRGAREMCEEFKNNPVGLGTNQFIAWVRRLENQSKLVKIDEMLDNGQAMTLAWEDSAVNFFDLNNKQKPKVLSDVKQQGVVQAPQTLLSNETNVSANFSPLFQTLVKRLERLMSPNIVLPWSKNSSCLEAVLTQLMGPDYLEKLMELDISKFDKSQLEALHKFKMLLYGMLGMNTDMLLAYEAGHACSLVKNFPFGIDLKVYLQHRTGDPTTLFGNTVAMMAIIACAENFSPKYFMGVGDDSNMDAGDESKAAYNELQYGDLANLETKRLRPRGSSYFCGSFIVRDSDGVFHFAKDPVKIAFKLGSPNVVSPVELSERFVSLTDELTSWNDPGVVQLLADQVACRYKMTTDPLILIDAIKTVTKSFEVYRDLWTMPSYVPRNYSRYIKRLKGFSKTTMDRVRKFIY